MGRTVVVEVEMVGGMEAAGEAPTLAEAEAAAAEATRTGTTGTGTPTGGPSLQSYETSLPPLTHQCLSSLMEWNTGTAPSTITGDGIPLLHAGRVKPPAPTPEMTRAAQATTWVVVRTGQCKP